jgi:hypothetical protein
VQTGEGTVAGGSIACRRRISPAKRALLFAGPYVTPLAPGKYIQVSVTVKGAVAGCAMQKLQVQSLNGGVPVRSSYLLSNAAYDAAAD